MFSDRGRVCVFVIDGKDHDQQHNDDRMERSEDKFHSRYQKLKAKLHFGYQKINSISKFQIPGVGGVKSRNVKCRNPETGTSTKNPFRSFADWEIKDQRNFNL
jgi:hypothetical protein